MKKVKNYINKKAVQLSRYLSAVTACWKRKQQIIFLSIIALFFLSASILAITHAFSFRWRSSSIGTIRFPTIQARQSSRQQKVQPVIPDHLLRYVDSLAELSKGKNIDSLIRRYPAIKDSLIKIQKLLNNH